MSPQNTHGPCAPSDFVCDWPSSAKKEVPPSEFWELVLTLEEFEKTYRVRIQRLCRRECSKRGLPRDMREDLYQECILAAIQPLESWRPGGMSIYTWCLQAMKKRIFGEYTVYHGFPPRVERKHFRPNWIQASVSKERISPLEDIDLKVDVERILGKEPQSEHLRRFLLGALDLRTGGQMAAESEKTRQAVNHMRRKTRRQMLKTFADFKKDRAASLIWYQTRVVHTAETIDA